MKQKVVKRLAADESRSIAKQSPDPSARDAAFHIFCERYLQLSPEHFQSVLESDAWDS